MMTLNYFVLLITRLQSRTDMSLDLTGDTEKEKQI